MSDDLTVRPESGYVIKLKVEEQPHPRGWSRSKRNSFNSASLYRYVSKHLKGELQQGQVYMYTEPEKVTSITLDPTTLPADDAKQKPIGWMIESFESDSISISKRK